MASEKDSNGLLSFFSSTTGKKYLTGASGLALVGFTIAHLLGNLSLLFPDGATFNAYAKTLHDLGPLLYLAELGLLAFFGIHIAIGIGIYLKKRKARPVGYKSYKTVGGQSRQSFSSKTMIWTGLVLLFFLVFHLWSFKYGPGMEEGYITLIDDEPTRDLYRLVIERFKSLPYVIGYTFVMLLLGFHLRHGVWSALTSLTLVKPGSTNLIYTIALILGILLAGGFLLLPIYIYLFGPEPTEIITTPASMLLLFSGKQQLKPCHHLK